MRFKEGRKYKLDKDLVKQWRAASGTTGTWEDKLPNYDVEVIGGFGYCCGLLVVREWCREV